MISRCTRSKDRSYERYGALGIRVCERWRIYDNFIADMGRRPSAKHSLDRIDPLGNYMPENCRWATAVQQARNTRKTRYVLIDGHTMPLIAAAELAGVRPSVAHYRWRRGIRDAKTLLAPADFTKRTCVQR